MLKRWDLVRLKAKKVVKSSMLDLLRYLKYVTRVGFFHVIFNVIWQSSNNCFRTSVESWYIRVYHVILNGINPVLHCQHNFCNISFFLSICLLADDQSSASTIWRIYKNSELIQDFHDNVMQLRFENKAYLILPCLVNTIAYVLWRYHEFAICDLHYLWHQI